MPHHAFFFSGTMLKVMYRSLLRNKSYTVINLLGLALGFGIFIFAAMYVYFETNFERFHRHADNIYRVTYRFAPEGNYQVHWARIPFDYINQLPQDVSGVKHLIRFQNHERKYVRVGQEKFRPDHVYVTDKEVFSVFNFHLTSGNPATALAEPHSIVISQTLAKKYFGDDDPVGKEIYVIGDLEQTETLHRITGVMKDLPANTHLPVNMFISFKDEAARSGWAYTYIMLEEGTDINQIESEMPAFVRQYDEQGAANTTLFFQPLRDIHLHSSLAREIVPNGKILYVRMVALAGIFILIMAVINFMNLNSAMALGRAREMGMRKIMGASRPQLISYLLTDAVCQCIVALMIGSVMVYLAFPFLQQWVTLQFLPNLWMFAGSMLAVAIICGLISGIYPVLLLTALKPMDVVKTSKALTFTRRESPFSLKRVMVTLQFCISVMLLGSALIAYNQFRYLNEKNLGIKREAVMAIPGVPNNVTAGFTTFKHEVSAIPGVKAVSACMEVPSREIRDAGPVLVEQVNSDPSAAPIMDIQIIDHDMPEVLGLEFLAGENISDPLDTTVPVFTDDFTIQQYLMTRPLEYLINETAMRELGWRSPDDAIGQRISWSIGDLVLPYGPIRGVVKDFHQETLKNKVDPVVLVNEPIWLRTFLINIDTDGVEETIAGIQSSWDKLFPYYPMEYYFLDDLYENLYKGERLQLQLLFLFSALAIVIAFIGLIGLITFALKTRLKEIAVRRVLGASLRDLIGLMSREYLLVLFIGSAVAIPVSVLGVQQWLSDFAYRVDVTPLSYLIAVSLVVVLLLTTIGLQTLSTSQINPADTLKEE